VGGGSVFVEREKECKVNFDAGEPTRIRDMEVRILFSTQNGTKTATPNA
jgi:hypothetical protein